MFAFIHPYEDDQTNHHTEFVVRLQKHLKKVN